MSSNPLPLYVSEETLQPAAALSDAQIQSMTGGDSSGRQAGTVLGTDYTVGDRNDLAQTGWGVLFASDLPDGVKQQLQPLLTKRLKDVGTRNPNLYKEFTVDPGTAAHVWAASQHIDLAAPVRPGAGVPYYLLLVGSPQSISFEFQDLLKMQFAVGRLYFDDIANYGHYAASVVAYEDTNTPPAQCKNAAVWVTRNGSDPATTLLSQALRAEFLQGDSPLGEGNFHADAFFESDATYAQLLDILRGNLDGGRPALIFTGSHGFSCRLDPANPERQLALQGSLVTADWAPGQAFATDGAGANQLCGAAVPPDAKLDGTVVFLFACYSCGCPKFDSYHVQADGTPVQIAQNDMISSLSQALLSRGALAVIGHLDQTFSYAFSGVDGAPTPQVLRGPLEYLMQGRRVGWSADDMTNTWTNLSAELRSPEFLALRASDPTEYGHVATASSNARNFILLGDPAARLRVSELQPANA